MQYRVNHLAVLVRALLPSSGDANTLNERLSHLLGEDSEDSEQTISSLAQIRAAAILTGSHDHTWRQNTVPPYKYHVGDLGYLPKGKDFGSFVVLCNVLKNGDTSLDVSQHATGWQSSWNNGFLQRQELAPFPQPPNLSGCALSVLSFHYCVARLRLLCSWPVVVPPGTQQDLQVVHEAMVIHMGSAWNFLLQNGRRFASVHKIKPQDLILSKK